MIRELRATAGSAPRRRRDRHATITAWFNSIWYDPRNNTALITRWTLGLVALIYRGLASLRSTLYSRGLLQSVTLATPVIVVGNLSVGGTGKTPLLIWLAGELRARGFSPGVVARGYRGRSREWPKRVTTDSDAGEVGDEAVLLARRTGCPVAVGPDRVAAGQKLLAEDAIDVVLSDDGLQHYRLARTFEIVVVDGLRGLGNGLCLPAGPLREPMTRLGRVDAIVINGDSGTHEWERAVGPTGDTCIVRARLEAVRVYRLDGSGEARELRDFAGRTVKAVAGIGHPERFFAMLEQAGLDVVRCPLPDHADISEADLQSDAMPVFLTEKDAVKCARIAHGEVWCVAVDLRFDTEAAQALLKLILDRLPQRSSSTGTQYDHG